MTDGRKRSDLKVASDAKQGRADDLLGAVVPSRGSDNAAVSLPPEADLSNVVAFARRNKKSGEASTPPLDVASQDRPAPYALSRERKRQIALLVGASVLVHGALFAFFNREPEPHASIGVISVTAEIVLGGQTNAGESKTPSESEVSRAPSPTADDPNDTQTEKAKKNLAEERAEQPKEDAKPEKTETVTAKAEEAPPVEKPPVQPDQAELVVQTKPAENPKPTAEEKKPESKILKKIREAARHLKDDGESKRERSAPTSVPSVASTGVGRGRSDLDTNYRGIVAAHLARYKQMPTSAQAGSQGTVTVSFSLSGSGSVGSVRLIKGSGIAAFDQEATAMVRRASPFPAPPSGRAQSFTVPVAFHMR